jgi:hypothetical protein
VNGLEKDVDSIEKNCPCKRTKCERHAECFACREHHKTLKNSLPYCERLKQKEERKVKRHSK